jgi:hypothetical protein
MTSNAQAKLDHIEGTQVAIKAAIETKGVPIGPEVTFREFSEKIGMIATGTDISDANSVVDDVLVGKTFYAASGGKKTGTMPDNAAVSTDIAIKDTVVPIAPGRHIGLGSVKISDVEQAKIIADNIKAGITILGQAGSASVRDIADANAVAGDVLTTKSFYSVSGGRKMGSMANLGTVSTDIIIKTTQVTIAAGKHSGAGIVKIAATEQAKIIPANVKAGITMLGVVGDSNVVDTSTGDAIAGDVLSAKKAWVDGLLVTGSMADNGNVSTDIAAKATEVTIAAGKHSGSGVVKIAAAEQAKIISGNIREGVTILGVIGNLAAPLVGDYRVRFFDYDGSLLKEERVNSGQSATAPATPTHQYLTFNSWVNSFSNVTSDIDVGALYDSTDGKTYIFLTLTAGIGLNKSFYIVKEDSSLLTITWGDGTSSTDSSVGVITLSKTYPAAGNYIASIACQGFYSFGDDNYNFIGSGPYSGGADKDCVTRIILGTTVKSLSTNCLGYFGNLSSIVIPLGVESLGPGCFSSTKLVGIVIPSGIIAIPASFINAAGFLSSVVLPPTITSIGDSAFGMCNSLEEIIIPASVNSLGSSVFSTCPRLKRVKSSWIIEAIPDDTCGICNSLEEFDIPSTVLSIGNGAFGACTKLSLSAIPPFVTSIGYGAFSECNSILSLIIPASVTDLGHSSFENIRSCLDFVIEATDVTPYEMKFQLFQSINGLAKIYVPDAYLAAFKNALGIWQDYIFPVSTRP